MSEFGSVTLSPVTGTFPKKNFQRERRIIKMDGKVSQRCVSKFKIEVRICIPAIQ